MFGTATVESILKDFLAKANKLDALAIANMEKSDELVEQAAALRTESVVCTTEAYRATKISKKLKDLFDV